jgi:hypothetical protein
LCCGQCVQRTQRRKRGEDANAGNRYRPRADLPIRSWRKRYGESGPPTCRVSSWAERGAAAPTGLSPAKRDLALPARAYDQFARHSPRGGVASHACLGLTSTTSTKPGQGRLKPRPTPGFGPPQPGDARESQIAGASDAPCAGQSPVMSASSTFDAPRPSTPTRGERRAPEATPPRRARPTDRPFAVCALFGTSRFPVSFGE